MQVAKRKVESYMYNIINGNKIMKDKPLKRCIIIFSLISFVIAMIFSVPKIYAYFADGDNKDNELRIGYNTIEIKEDFEDPSPGKKTVKKPMAVNTGTVDCYIRGKVTLSDSRVETYIDYYTDSTIGFNDSWRESSDGWFYYYDILKPSETSDPIFTHIFLAEDCPEELKGFAIDVIFESVQSDGFSNAQKAFLSIN